MVRVSENDRCPLVFESQMPVKGMNDSKKTSHYKTMIVSFKISNSYLKKRYI